MIIGAHSVVILLCCMMCFSQIRAASFTMVVTLCKHCGVFVSSHARLFCGVVLGSLGEKEPVVVGPLWEGALLVVNLNHVRSLMCALCMYCGWVQTCILTE